MGALFTQYPAQLCRPKHTSQREWELGGRAACYVLACQLGPGQLHLMLPLPGWPIQTRDILNRV